MAHAILAVAALTGCLNDGSVPDKHAITFEKPVPAGGPSKARSIPALQQRLVANVPEGGTAKEVSVTPVRYAAVLWPFPEKDFFVCARRFAKNRFGTYEQPQNALMTIWANDQAKGWEPALVKVRAA